MPLGRCPPSTARQGFANSAPHAPPEPELVRMERMTAGEATVASLIAHGLDTVYALPGVHNDPLFDALFQASERIRTVHTRHEQGAAYMALRGFGRSAFEGRNKPQAPEDFPGARDSFQTLL